MIYICVIQNLGGMKRIFQFLDIMTDTNEIQQIIFSPKKPDLHKNQHWICWDGDKENPISGINIQKHTHAVEELVKRVGTPKIIIADFFILPLFQKFQCVKYLDCHILNRTMIKRMSKYQEIDRGDFILKESVVLPIKMSAIPFLKFESEVMKSVNGFIVYSENSERFLKEDYADLIKDKTIIKLKLSAKYFNSDFIETTSKDIDYYTFSRFHPQKGLFQLTNKDWNPNKLVIRGCNPNRIKDDALIDLKARSIEFRPWDQDDNVIRNEILRSKVILFPSIYEPWGLSLSESLSVGAVCIAHKNQSGHEEQIEHGHNGFLIDMSSQDLISELEALKKFNFDEISKNAKLTAKNQIKESEKSYLILKEFLITSLKSTI